MTLLDLLPHLLGLAVLATIVAHFERRIASNQ